jgi:hypothetical protein
MGQQLQPWRSGNGEKLWLSMLIEAMEEVSRPEFRAMPCDQSVLTKVRAQLTRSASAIFKKDVAYSPAICSRGRLPRSIPRSFASSRTM